MIWVVGIQSTGILIAGYLKSGFGLGGVFAGVSAIVVIAAMSLFAGYRFFLQNDLRRYAVRNADVAAFRSRSYELETS